MAYCGAGPVYGITAVLGWDYNNPETAVFGTVFHVFEYLFVRLAPILFTGAVVGIFLVRKKG